MNRTAKGEIISVVAVVAIFALGLIFILFTETGQEITDNIIHTEKVITETENVHTSLSDLYHVQVDDVAPAYLDTTRSNCLAFGGTWYDRDDRIGCYNIPVWDHATQCASPQVQLLENVCDSVQDTVFVCDNHNVGCSY